MAIEEKNSRTAMMIGEDGVNLLREKHVLIFGLGGVGGILTEALARAGVGHLTIVDKDTVSESNLNRQVIALRSSIGRAKTAVMRERLLDIDPTLDVTEKCVFYLPETADAFDFSEYDYIVDAVDTVTAKLLIIENARRAGVPVVSSMGTGNKLHPELFRLADISETEGCPLARVMRRELKKRGIEKGVRVVFSPEKPVQPDYGLNAEKSEMDGPAFADKEEKAVEKKRKESREKLPPGSVSFTPPVAGLILAGEVIRGLLQTETKYK